MAGISNNRDAGVKATQKIPRVSAGETVSAAHYNKLVDAINGLTSTLINTGQRLGVAGGGPPTIYVVQADAEENAVQVTVKKWRLDGTRYQGDPVDQRSTFREGNINAEYSPGGEGEVGEGGELQFFKPPAPMYKGDLVIAAKTGDGKQYVVPISFQGAEQNRIPDIAFPGARPDSQSPAEPEYDWNMRKVSFDLLNEAGGSADGVAFDVLTYATYDTSDYTFRIFTRRVTVNSRGQVINIGAEGVESVFTAEDCEE